MTEQQPITPPPELVKQWWTEFESTDPEVEFLAFIATQAARWGADMELEACCEWTYQQFKLGLQWSKDLRTARRPKPPSLKEQALQALYRFDDTEGHADLTLGQIEEDFVVIRRAIESLPD